MAMRTILKGLAPVLAIIAILSSFGLSNIRIALSTDLGGRLDIFVQREPYSGRGLNASSDAFGPGEMVQVFALMTYNEDPAKEIPVAFEIFGPKNPSGRIVFSRTGFTDENGMVMIDFRLPYLNGSTFGQWVVYGSAAIGELAFTDMVSFQVGWIVEIVSIRTVDEHHGYQGNFTRNNSVDIELVLRSIAMVEKRTALTIMIYDELDMCVNSTEIDDFLVPPNGTLVYFYSSLYIPKKAFLGDAYAYASAYTASPSLGGVPYCPEVSTRFLITSREFHDVAVLNVYPSSYLVYVGDVLHISVVVKNLGNCTESFNVTVLTDSVVVMTSLVQNLGHGAERMIVFSWDTSHVPEGDYMLSALASYVPGEVDYENNRYVDGTVRVAAAPRREFVPDWFYWFLLLLLLILIGILLSAWLYRRRKKSEAAFYSGWTAWYYGYDLRGRNTRTFGKLKASGHGRIER